MKLVQASAAELPAAARLRAARAERARWAGVIAAGFGAESFQDGVMALLPRSTTGRLEKLTMHLIAGDI